MNSSALTSFQLQAKAEIDKTLARRDLAIEYIQQGNHEAYLFGEIAEQDLKIWIYEDELEFRSHHVQRLLEKPDFETQDEMLVFFLKELSKILQ